MIAPGKHAYEWLATALASIAAYYAIRSAMIIIVYLFAVSRGLKY